MPTAADAAAPTPNNNNTTTTTTTTTTATSEGIYDKAVAEVREILGQQDRDWRRIGEHVAAVGKAYGQDRVGKLAKDVGLAVNTLWRYRQVYERATEIEAKLAPGRVLNYSAVRELMNHPDIAEREFKSKPDMTKKDAQRIMHSLRQKDKANDGWRRKELEKQLDALDKAAKDFKRLELKLVKDPADYGLLKELVAQRPGFVTRQREGRDASDHTINLIEHLDEHMADAERNGGANEAAAREAARQSFEHERAKLVQGNDVDTEQPADDRKADHADALEAVL
jgi:hypothetical protein